VFSSTIKDLIADPNLLEHFFDPITQTFNGALEAVTHANFENLGERGLQLQRNLDDLENMRLTLHQLDAVNAINPARNELAIAFLTTTNKFRRLVYESFPIGTDGANMLCDVANNFGNKVVHTFLTKYSEGGLMEALQYLSDINAEMA